MKKTLIFFAALAVMLCFVVPAVVGPPGAGPILEAMSFDLGPSLSTQEAAIVAASASSPSETVMAYFLGYLALGVLMIGIAIAIASVLAYVSLQKPRGFANGVEERRRWV